MAKDEEKDLLAKAKKGDVDAMFELGNLYSFEGNEEEAQKWWRKAARKGHTAAKESRKGTLLGKRPMGGCTIFFIVLGTLIAAFITIGFIYGWGNAFWALLIFICAFMFFIGSKQ